MEFWVALGIEKTKDEEAVTAAYREKLKLVHPEEKPEEFMQLRSAYEEAMEYCRQPEDGEEPALPDSPVDAWVREIEKVYNYYPHRIDIEKWKELLENEVCMGLDSRLDARDALLKFFMEKYYIPKNIWLLFDEKFSLIENKEELYEKFPKRFIDDIVISSIENDPVVQYDMFAEGTTDDPDAYFELFFKTRREIGSGDTDSAEATIADIERTGIVHVYTRLLKGRLAAIKGESEKAEEIAKGLFEEYPEDYEIRMFRASMSFRAGDHDTAEDIYKKVLEKKPADISAKLGLADCLAAKNDLKDAKRLLFEVLDDIPYDEDVNKSLDDINERLKKEYVEKLAENPNDFETVLDYGWCLLQTKEPQKALEITEKLVAETVEQRCDLENFRTKTYLNVEQNETAMEHAELWLQAVKELPEGETEEEKRRKDKLGEILSLQCSTLFRMERYDEALQKAEECEAADPNRSETWDLRRRIYLERHDYDKAVECAEKFLELKPGHAAHYFLGVTLYEAERKQEAFYAFGEVLRYVQDLGSYIYRIRILCDFEQWEPAEEIINFLEENNVQSEAVRFCKVRIKYGRDSDKEWALKELYSIIENHEKGESDIPFMWEVYNMTAELDELNKTPDELIALLDKGIADKKDAYPLLCFRAFLLKKKEAYQEAIDQYLQILKYYPHERTANEYIGNIYYDEFDDIETALSYYQKQIPRRESAGLHEMTGLCLMYLERYEEAEKHFLRAIELEPERIRPRSNLGLLYEQQFDFERSLKIHEECMAINEKKEDKDKDRSIYSRYARVLARMERRNEAIEVHQKNIELFDSSSSASTVIALCVEDMQLERAEKLLEQYHKEEKITDRYYFILADIRKHQGKDKQFIKCINSLPDDDTSRYSELAEHYRRHEEYKKALECYKKLDELKDNETSSFVGWIDCLQRLGKKEEADKLIERALQSAEGIKKEFWHKALYVTKKAFALVAARRMDEAKELIDRAMTMPLCEHCRYGKCKDAYLALSDYYEALGEYQKAIDTCEEGQKIALDEVDFEFNVKRLQKALKAQKKNKKK